MKLWYWVTAAAVTVAGIGMMIEGGKDIRKEAKAAEESVQEGRFAGVREINVDLSGADLKLHADEKAETTTVRVSGMSEPVTVTCEEGKLDIVSKQKRTFQLFAFVVEQGGTVEITVPQETLDKVYTSIGSNEAEVTDISAQELMLFTGSGSVTLTDTEAPEQLVLSAGSGSLHLDSVTAQGEVSLGTGSGSVSMTSCDFGRLETNCGSGSITAEEVTVADTFKTDVGSGSIKGKNVTAGGSVTFDGGSGGVKIDGFDCADAWIDYGSGNVELNMLGGEGDYAVDCSEVTGNTTVGGEKGVNVTPGNGKRLHVETSGNVTIGFAQ